MFKRKKISLIGSGNIGGALASLINSNNLADVVMLDILEGVPQGKALDISQASSLLGSHSIVRGSNDYKDIENSDAIVVTSGITRKPGMSRDDLLHINADIINSVAINIKKYAPNAFIIVVTNPLDAMVYFMFKKTGLPSNMVIGMAGILDTSRLNLFLARELNLVSDDINSIILGGHGDLMVPLIRYCTISGIPIMEFVHSGWISIQQLDSIIERTKNGGAEIVSLLKNGSAYFAPAASIFQILESYLNDRKKVSCCAVYLNGQYGVKDCYIGVPVVIGSKGVERIIELNLTSEEKELFLKSLDSIHITNIKLK